MACCCCGWGPFGLNPGDDLFDYWDFTSTPESAEDDWKVATAWNVAFSGSGSELSGGESSLWRSCPPPTPSWPESGMTMTATIVPGTGCQQAGVFIGNARLFWIDATVTPWRFFHQACDESGFPLEGTSPVQIDATVYDLGSGATISVAVGGTVDASTYTIEYIANELTGSARIGIEELVTLSDLDTTAPVQAGVWANGDAQFDKPVLSCGPVTVALSCATLSFPAAWTATLGGFTAGTEPLPSPCQFLNGTFGFESFPDPELGPGPFWQAVTSTPPDNIEHLDDQQVVLLLVCGTTDGYATASGDFYLVINIAFGGLAYYSIPLTAFNPLGSNTLTLVPASSSLNCGTFPTTIVIGPAP